MIELSLANSQIKIPATGGNFCNIDKCKTAQRRLWDNWNMTRSQRVCRIVKIFSRTNVRHYIYGRIFQCTYTTIAGRQTNVESMKSRSALCVYPLAKEIYLNKNVAYILALEFSPLSNCGDVTSKYQSFFKNHTHIEIGKLSKRCAWMGVNFFSFFLSLRM